MAVSHPQTRITKTEHTISPCSVRTPSPSRTLCSGKCASAKHAGNRLAAIADSKATGSSSQQTERIVSDDVNSGPSTSEQRALPKLVEEGQESVGDAFFKTTSSENYGGNVVISTEIAYPWFETDSQRVGHTQAIEEVAEGKHLLNVPAVKSVKSLSSLEFKELSSNELLMEQDGIDETESNHVPAEEPIECDISVHSDGSELTAKKLYSCSLCTYTTKYSKNVARHMRKHTGKQDICHYCGFSTFVPNYLKKHIAQKHEQTNSFKCAECSFTCSVKEILSKHIKRIHQGYRPKQVERKCPHCDFTTMSSNIVLQTHIKRKHSTEGRPYACPHCSHTTTDEKYLKTHIKSVHEKIRPFKCPHCPFTAAFKQNLNTHIQKIHISPKPRKKQSKKNRADLLD